MLFRIEALAVEIADVAIVERAAAPLSEHELVGGRLEFGEQPLQRLIGCMLAIFDHSRELLVHAGGCFLFTHLSSPLGRSTDFIPEYSIRQAKLPHCLDRAPKPAFDSSEESRVGKECVST